jgi:hypothetical protein
VFGRQVQAWWPGQEEQSFEEIADVPCESGIGCAARSATIQAN